MSASTRRTRSWRGLVWLGALAFAFAVPAATQVIEAAPVEAYCPWGGTGGGLIPAGGWGQEWSISGTCDWDNVYHGNLLDAVDDGSCVWSEFIDDGVWNIQAYACTTGVWSDYWKFDRNGDYFSYINLCRAYGCYTSGSWPWNIGY